MNLANLHNWVKTRLSTSLTPAAPPPPESFFGRLMNIP